MNFDQFFLNLAVIASTTTLVTGYVTTHILKNLNTTGKQVAAWVVAFLLCAIGQLKGFGMFVDTTWLSVILTGVGAGLVSNGIFDLNLVQMLLELIGARKKATK